MPRLFPCGLARVTCLRFSSWHLPSGGWADFLETLRQRQGSLGAVILDTYLEPAMYWASNVLNNGIAVIELSSISLTARSPYLEGRGSFNPTKPVDEYLVAACE